MVASSLARSTLACLVCIGCTSTLEATEARGDALVDVPLGDVPLGEPLEAPAELTEEGCQQGLAPQGRAPQGLARAWQAERGPRPTTGSVLLDSRQGVELAGSVEAPIPNTDADRVVRLETNAPFEALSGARVLDARFIDGGVAVLDVEHTLVFHDATGTSFVLDQDVYGPLTTAQTRIAYVHGGPPDLELARVDVRTGVVERLTTAMAPVWSPALSPNGHEVLFVSGVEGTPRLHRVDAQGVVLALPRSARTPSSPTPPVWRDDTLIFEDEAGIAWLDLQRGELLAEESAHGLVADGERLTVDLAGERVEVVR